MDISLRTMTDKKVSAGVDCPLGATLCGGGVNFALFSRSADQVFLLLFDDPMGEPTDIIPFENRRRFVWSGFVHGLKAGQLYGYKVAGAHDPARGLRFNEQKLLLDPYAKAVTGKATNVNNLLLPYDPLSADPDLSLDNRDNSKIMPKCVVVDDAFDWHGDTPLDMPLEKLVIYEVHVKGFTAHSSSKVARPDPIWASLRRSPICSGWA